MKVIEHVKSRFDCDKYYRCTIVDCPDKVLIKARGLCRKHYLRFQRFGHPLGGGEFRATKAGEPIEWMRRHLDYHGDDCLIFPYGKHSAGYGALVDKGRRMGAHRWVCEQIHGPAPVDATEAAHSCGNGHLGCVNPKHLRWASVRDNALDRYAHGRRNKPHKLSRERASQIYAAKGAMTYAAAAENFETSLGTVADIWNGRTWAWLTGQEKRHPEQSGGR